MTNFESQPITIRRKNKDKVPAKFSLSLAGYDPPFYLCFPFYLCNILSCCIVGSGLLFIGVSILGETGFNKLDMIGWGVFICIFAIPSLFIAYMLRMYMIGQEKWKINVSKDSIRVTVFPTSEQDAVKSSSSLESSNASEEIKRNEQNARYLQDEALALYKKGCDHCTGKNDSEIDYCKALDYFKKAEELGYSEATVALKQLKQILGQ